MTAVMFLFTSKNKAKLKLISKCLFFNAETVSKQNYMHFLINKNVSFSHNQSIFSETFSTYVQNFTPQFRIFY